MKQINNLKAMFIYMMIAFVSVCVCGSFVSCSKDEVTGHDNNGNAVMSVKAEKKDTVPSPIYRDNSWVTLDTTIINLWWEYLRNDTIVDSLKNSTNVAAQIQRDLEKVQTTVNHLNNLGITAGQVVESRDGRNNYVYRQTMTDLDGQTYNGLFKSGYASLKDLENVHGKLVGFQTTGFRNIPQPTPADMDTLVLTRVGWKAIFEVENGKNLAGQQFEIALDSTDHFRYIPKDAPTILYTSPIKYKIPGNWESKWVIGKRYFWSNNTVTADSMFVPLKGSYSKIELKDKVVGSFEYVHEDGSVKWSGRYKVASDDSRITLYENKGTKKSYATNGIENDQFYTEFAVTVQDAVVEFCDSTWTIGADEASLTTKRNIFAEATSDMEGYSMVKFVDEEIAKWNGEYAQTLEEKCNLYLKLATPDLEKIEFVGTKVHTEGMAKIDGSIAPVYTDGSKGAAIEFSWEKAESWKWMKDSVIFNDVDFFMQETGTLTLKGEEKKTAKTFATDNENITIKCNEYTADFQTTVKVDGGIKYTTWRAVWYEDFEVVYAEKKVALTKSSYSVKAQNDKLSKDEARSNATSEVWGYSVEGIFTIDEDSRSAMGYGRLTKALEEEVVTEYWDRFNFETDAHEYTDRVEYFLKWIREYSTGKKTSQEVKVVLKRNAEGSAYTITVENPQREIGSQSENSSYIARTESSDDITINYDWKTSSFELPNVFDGKTTKNDIATFVDPTNVEVSKKNSKGEDVTIELPSFEHTLSSTVSEPTVTSENDEKTVRTYERVWSWASSQCTSTAKSYGNINTLKSTPVTPDFDIEVGSIYATVSRPSNRNGNPITAYTYLFVSKDGTKCLPLGIYKDVVTEGKIQDMHSTYNGACYVKDQDAVVPTNCYSHEGLGMMVWADKDGNPVDAETHTWLQGNHFNDRGNDWINHTGKYAPTVVKKGNVYVVTFEGTKVSYTFKGWDVK
jgi:hypothetical protein